MNFICCGNYIYLEVLYICIFFVIFLYTIILCGFRVRGIHKMLKMEDFSKLHVQVLGAEDTYGPHAIKGDVRVPNVIYV